MAAHQTALKH